MEGKIFKINKEVISFLKDLCLECPNLIIKGGSSLLIRNYFSEKDDYRYSTDIDITVVGPSKNRGPFSQYDPKKNRLDDILENKNIKHTCKLIKQRRAICKININGVEVDLESSVPNDYEYLDYDEVEGIKLAKLSKVLADKIMILIEYQFDGTDLFGPYLRHGIDIFMIRKWYDYKISVNSIEIIKYIRKRIESNWSRYNLLYENLEDGWNRVIENVFMKEGSTKYANEFIFNMARTNSDVISKRIIDTQTIKEISLLLKEV